LLHCAWLSALAFIAFAAPAWARAPVLVSVGQQDHYANATWTLPPGVKARFVEVSLSPEVRTEEFSAGYFVHLLDFQALRSNDTSYQETVFRLSPGTTTSTSPGRT
jgi:hypothetical protein